VPAGLQVGHAPQSDAQSVQSSVASQVPSPQKGPASTGALSVPVAESLPIGAPSLPISAPSVPIGAPSVPFAASK
jgi:hypothetical protein